MKRATPTTILALALGLGVAPCATAAPAAGTGTYTVTSGADSGEGTLRAGLEAGHSRFVVSPSVGTIEVASTLVYAGTRALSITGNGVALEGDGLEADLLLVTSGADVTLRDLTLTDGGGYALGEPALDGTDEGSASGLRVVVPAGATGTVDLTLDHVVVDGVSGHGVWVDDNAGSPASVSAVVRGTTVVDAGYGAFDRDGIRVDETGAGDITWVSSRSLFTANGADGVELDERGDGSVFATSAGDSYTDNGGYCLPLVEAGLDPEENEGLLCVEDGEFDLDDGIDIDEADAGAIVSDFSRATVTGNYDEGLDWDEAGEGSVTSTVKDSVLSWNWDEGHKITEEDAGDLVVSLSRVSAVGNRNNDGLQFEEFGAGDVVVRLTRVTVTDTPEGDGVKVDETDDGDLEMTVVASVLARNDGQDLDLEQADAGQGRLSVVRSGDLDIKADGIEVR